MEEGRIGLILPVLLVLAAAMFAGSIGGDSVTGFSTSDNGGESAECIACKNACTKTANSCRKSVNEKLRDCMDDIKPACDEAEACINAARNPTSLNRCKVLLGKCTAIINHCTTIAGEAAVCEDAYQSCMDKCDKNECKTRDWRSPIGAIFG